MDFTTVTNIFILEDHRSSTRTQRAFRIGTLTNITMSLAHPLCTLTIRPKTVRPVWGAWAAPSQRRIHHRDLHPWNKSILPPRFSRYTFLHITYTFLTNTFALYTIATSNSFHNPRLGFPLPIFILSPSLSLSLSLSLFLPLFFCLSNKERRARDACALLDFVLQPLLKWRRIERSWQGGGGVSRA